VTTRELLAWYGENRETVEAFISDVMNVQWSANTSAMLALGAVAIERCEGEDARAAYAALKAKVEADGGTR
jgi:hypothetical protein